MKDKEEDIQINSLVQNRAFILSHFLRSHLPYPHIHLIIIKKVRWYFRRWNQKYSMIQFVYDYMFSKQISAGLLFYIIFLQLSCLFTSTTADELHHITKATNCTITFDTNTSSTNTSQIVFKKCRKQLCLRNLFDGTCSNLQAKCMFQCCGSFSFDIVKCQDYNEKKLTIETASNAKLAIILVSVLLGLTASVAIFAIIYLKCCQKEKQSKIVAKKLHTWKDCYFTDQKECSHCKQKSAFLLSQCGAFFHMKCLIDNGQWKCCHCNSNIKKLKIFCPSCLNKSIVIEAQNYDDLDKKVCQAYEMHSNRCFDYIAEEIDSERKFTEATKQ